MVQKDFFSHPKPFSLVLVFALIAAQIIADDIKVGFFVLLALLIWLLILNGFSLKMRPLPGLRPLVVIFSLGTVGGIVSCLMQMTTLWQLTRDVMYVLVVFLYYILASKVREKESKNQIICTVFLYAGIYAIISLIIAVPKFAERITEGNLLRVFSVMRLDEFTISLGAFLALTGNPNGEKRFYGKIVDRVMSAAIIIGFVLSFSRTSLAILAILLVTQIQRAPKKLFKVVGVLAASLAVAYAIAPDLFNTYIEKIGSSFTEISSGVERWNSTDIVHNWRGYEKYCAQRNFEEDFTLLQQIFGKGFGAGVDVYGYSFLVTGEETLAKLHNGYYTMLIKGGIVGYLLQILFLLMPVYWLLRHAQKDGYRMVAIGMALSMAFSTYVIMGPLWGQNCFLAFLMLAICDKRTVKNEHAAI